MSRIRPTIADCILIAGLIVVAAVWASYDVMHVGRVGAIEIYNQDGFFRELSPERDVLVSVPGPLGKSIVEVSSGMVYMRSSPCHGKVCIHMGGISRPGQGIVCVPNRVYIRIRGDRQNIDAVTY